MKTVLSSCEVNSIDIRSDRQMSDLQYADYVILLSEDMVQVLPDCLNDGAFTFEVRFVPSKCKNLVHIWNGSKPNFFYYTLLA